jgi:hypothetical protein
MSSGILHRAYTDLKTANCNGWISSVERLLCQLGVCDVWHNQDRLMSCVNFPIQTIVQCLKDQYHQSWHADMADNSKLSSYCLFKNDIVSVIKCYKFRIYLTKLRCSDHKLEIEIGRHSSEVYQEVNGCANYVK